MRKPRDPLLKVVLTFLMLRRARQDMHDKRRYTFCGTSEESTRAMGARVFKGCIFVSPEAQAHLRRLRTRTSREATHGSLATSQARG